MAQGGKNKNGSRIVSQGRRNDGQELPAPETSTLTAEVGGTETGNSPTSKCLTHTLVYMDSDGSPRQMRTPSTLERGKASHQGRLGVRTNVIVAFAFF